MADLILAVSATVAVAGTLAWLFVPELRARLERPKQRFVDDVVRYDERRDA